MLDNKIATRRGIMTSHRETAYKEYCNGLVMPKSEDLADRSILLPLYYPMTQEDINTVIENFIKMITA
jgi:dTDP-4-amino-4,6-dideoxygalactose transaminase